MTAENCSKPSTSGHAGSSTRPRIAALDEHFARACSLLTNRHALEAFDLEREDPKTRDRYGRHPHGQTVLMARRLVEAGVPIVTVFWPNDGITNVSVYWDTHNRNFIDLKTRLMPPLTRPSAPCSTISTCAGCWTRHWSSGRANSVGRHALARRSSAAPAPVETAAITGHIVSRRFSPARESRGAASSAASDRWAAYPAATRSLRATSRRRSITCSASTRPVSWSTPSAARSASLPASQSGRPGLSIVDFEGWSVDLTPRQGFVVPKGVLGAGASRDLDGGTGRDRADRRRFNQNLDKLLMAMATQNWPNARYPFRS